MNDLLLYLIAEDHSFDDKNISNLQFLYAPPAYQTPSRSETIQEPNNVIVISNDEEENSGVIIIDYYS
jgi:hypothetical protein